MQRPSAVLAALLLARAAAAADPAPDFVLRDVDGNVARLSDHKGEVVLIDFWATWCAPCKDELPHLQSLYTELGGQGFTVLAVSTDDTRTRGQVKPLLKRAGYTFPVLHDPDSATLAVHNPAKTLPFSVLVGRDFTVRGTHSGFSAGDEVGLRAEILALLAEPAASTGAPPAPAGEPASPVE